MPQDLTEEPVAEQTETVVSVSSPVANQWAEGSLNQVPAERGIRTTPDSSESEGAAANTRAIRNANLALGFMACGTVVSFLACKRFAELQWLTVVSSGFEAGMVGGLADWFAVEALFRKIPIPIIGDHTDILRSKHEEVSKKLAALVQNEWLSPEAIKQQLAKVEVSTRLVELMHDEENLRRFCEGVRSVSYEFLPSLDTKALAADLAPVLKRIALETDLAGIIGHASSKWIELRGDVMVWDTVASPLANYMVSPEFRISGSAVLQNACDRWASTIIGHIDHPLAIDASTRLLSDALDHVSTWSAVGKTLHGLVESDKWDVLSCEVFGLLPKLLEGRFAREFEDWLASEIEGYIGEKNWVTRAMASLAGPNTDELARDVVKRLRRNAKELIEDPAHPLRERLKTLVHDFALRLERGDTATIASCVSWRNRAVEDDSIRGLVVAVAASVKKTMAADLAAGGLTQWKERVPWNDIAGFFGTECNELLLAVAAQPEHPAREALRSAFVAFAGELRDGAQPHRDTINRLLTELVEHLDAEKIVTALLDASTSALRADLQKPAGTGAMRIRDFVRKTSESLRYDKLLAAMFDGHARSFAGKIIDANRSHIGEAVRGKLFGTGSPDDADKFVDQIRSSTVSDLQRIRINGAVLGSAIGIGLGAIKLIF